MEHGRIEVPLAAEVGTCEERAAPRFTLLIRAAKLIAPQGEFLCVIRDVSETGISLRGFHAMPAAGPLALELQTGERFGIEQVWSRGTEAGYRFLDAVEIDRLVADAGAFPKRKLRLAIAFPVRLGFLGREVDAEVINISQQGAMIRSATRLALAQPLRVISDILPEVRARVRWRRDASGGGEYGLVFDDTFSLGQLALFAAGAQAPELLVETSEGAAQRR